MSQTETAKVAADLTASILGQAAANFAGDPTGDNAARMLAEMEGRTVEAPQAAPVVSDPTPAAEAAPAVETPVADEPEAVLPDFSPQLSDELQALLDEPDFDEEAALEVAAEAADSYDETFDQDTAAQLRAKDKKIKWLEEQNANKSRKGWVEEQASAYPFLREYAPKELKEALAGVTSRRAAARVAADLNEKYTRVLGPAVADLNVAKAAAKTDAEKAARGKAATQWGLPAGDVAGTEVLAEQERALVEARERRAPLIERIKILGGIAPSSR